MCSTRKRIVLTASAEALAFFMLLLPSALAVPTCAVTNPPTAADIRAGNRVISISIANDTIRSTMGDTSQSIEQFINSTFRTTFGMLILSSMSANGSSSPTEVNITIAQDSNYTIYSNDSVVLVLPAVLFTTNTTNCSVHFVVTPSAGVIAQGSFNVSEIMVNEQNNSILIAVAFDRFDANASLLTRTSPSPLPDNLSLVIEPTHNDAVLVVTLLQNAEFNILPNASMTINVMIPPSAMGTGIAPIVSSSSSDMVTITVHGSVPYVQARYPGAPDPVLGPIPSNMIWDGDGHAITPHGRLRHDGGKGRSTKRQRH